MTDRSSSLPINLINHNLYLNGNSQPIRLRPKEAQLLAALLRTPNQVVSRATLMWEVWRTDFLGDTRTLEVHVHALRRKIEDNPGRPHRIVTVKGVGYCWVVDETR